MTQPLSEQQIRLECARMALHYHATAPAERVQGRPMETALGAYNFVMGITPDPEPPASTTTQPPSATPITDTLMAPAYEAEPTYATVQPPSKTPITDTRLHPRSGE